MLTTLQMWDKLIAVVERVETREQSNNAMRYATLWYRDMETRMTVTDVEFWVELVGDLRERFQTA